MKKINTHELYYQNNELTGRWEVSVCWGAREVKKRGRWNLVGLSKEAGFCFIKENNNNNHYQIYLCFFIVNKNNKNNLDIRS